MQTEVSSQRLPAKMNSYVLRKPIISFIVHAYSLLSKITSLKALAIETNQKSVGWQPSTVPSLPQSSVRLLPSSKYTFLSPKETAFL